MRVGLLLPAFTYADKVSFLHKHAGTCSTAFPTHPSFSDSRQNITEFTPSLALWSAAVSASALSAAALCGAGCLIVRLVLVVASVTYVGAFFVAEGRDAVFARKLSQSVGGGDSCDGSDGTRRRRDGLRGEGLLDGAPKGGRSGGHSDIKQ